MTVEELLNHIKPIDLRTEYQHVKECPIEPISYEEAPESNVIGEDDYRALKAMCFNNY